MTEKKQKKDIKKEPEEKKASVLIDDQRERPVKKVASVVKKTKAVSEAKAKVRFLKVSPKKVRLVIDAIRGLQAEEALNKLRVINKGSVPAVLKLLNSAIANAENNFKLKKKDLYIKQIVANQGPTLHRWKPAAFGAAHPIRERTTHLELVLGLRNAAKPGAIKEAKADKKPETKKAGQKPKDKEII